DGSAISLTQQRSALRNARRSERSLDHLHEAGISRVSLAQKDSPRLTCNQLLGLPYPRVQPDVYWHPPRLMTTDQGPSPISASNRRSFLSAALAGAALFPASARAERDWSGRDPVRYPDPDIIALDKRFSKYRIINTPLKRLHTGLLW